MKIENLHDVIIKTITEADFAFLSQDRTLPQAFIDFVKKSSQGEKYIFNKFTTLVKYDLSIYCPNQWFFIAAYYCRIYPFLTQYRELVLSCIPTDVQPQKYQELFKSFVGDKNKSLEFVDALDVDKDGKECLAMFLSDYGWWKGGKGIERNDFFYSPILASARLVNQSQAYVAEICKFLVENPPALEILNNEINTNHSTTLSASILPLQQIYYGAPGTGKSHTINELTEGESVIRTTFHPDSDYSTFVGAYKPTMGLLPICDELGQPMKIGSTVLHKEQIIYEFVDQAFLQAYVQAWKFYAENSDTAKKQYLIIEEINRGNCAQIFGDLFQLLDRNDSGFSVYPINADKDMKKQLAKAFKKDGVTITIPNADKINALYKEKNIVSKVLSGEILVLPNNLYIWATMNTSDQSLFPIDSAFKRRWEWQYMPIGKGYDENGQEIKWTIEGATKKFSWWSFLEKINAQIGEATQSEDKKLGFFFCKATDGVISAEKFVGKVIFYLWNDVFKNNGFEGPIFKDVDGTELSFAKFYKSDMKGNAIVQKDKVELFLNNLGVEEFKDGNIPSEEPEEDEDGNQESSPSTGRDYTKFSINGVGNYAKNNLAAECVKKYIELNPTKTAEEVLNDWRSLGNIVPHFIESKEQYDARIDNSKRSHEIACGGAVIYVAHNGYGNNGKVLVLMEAVNQKDWGIIIQKNV